MAVASSQRGYSAASLSELPDEQLDAILRHLTLVERVRAEGTCKRWLCFLRHPSFWAELDLDELYEDAEAHGLEYRQAPGCRWRCVAEAAIAHLNPGTLRSLRNSFLDATALENLAPWLCQLEVLHLGCVGEHTTISGALSLSQAMLRSPLLRKVDLGEFVVYVDHEDEQNTSETQLTALLRTAMPGCTASFRVLDYIDRHEVDDERLLLTWRTFGGALGRALQHCTWEHLTIVLDAGNGHISDACALPLLRGLLDVVQHAECVRVLQIFDILFAPSDALTFVAHVPPHMRLLGLQIACTAGEAGQLANALRPGAVRGCGLFLDGPWQDGPLLVALDALRAVMNAAVSQNEAFTVEHLGFELPPTPTACALVTQFFSDAAASGGLVSFGCVRIAAGVDAVRLMLPHLPASLSHLTLDGVQLAAGGTGITSDALALLAGALESGFPSGGRVRIDYASSLKLDTDELLSLAHALMRRPPAEDKRQRLEVDFLAASQAAVAAVAAVLPASAQYHPLPPIIAQYVASFVRWTTDGVKFKVSCSRETDATMLNADDVAAGNEGDAGG